MSHALGFVPEDQRALVSPPLSFTSSGHPFIPIDNHPTLEGLSLTLPHPSDDEVRHQLRVLNDLDRVQRWLDGPPYPYTEQDATSWNKLLLERWHTAFDRIVTGAVPNSDLGHAGPESTCGLQSIRFANLEAGEHLGQGRWVGDLGVVRWEYPDVVDPVEREALRAQNAAREIGDPDLIWSVGFYLDPDFHGQQILTYALRTIIDKYLVPVLQAERIKSSAYVGNYGSRRVHEKCGFEWVRGELGGDAVAAQFETDAIEARGGGKRQHWLMEWRRPKS